MRRNLKLANTCEECMYRNLFFEMRNELETIKKKLVRCKECIHCQNEVIDDTMPIYIYCDLWEGDTEWDSFCSYGERAEE